ncbi:MAG: polysaccharide deacetylase family protein [Bacteroidales bacterium]|nr:polysaccharide deacetylase family protein [Bacteroidales bacterium]
MLLIHSPSIPNRLLYITDLMVTKILGIEVRLTASPEEFTGYDGPKFSYANTMISDGLFIEASGFLFDIDLTFQDVTSDVVDGVPVIFKSVDPLSALPFDPFAAAFYMVSRYEEYQPLRKDSFGRYPATESIAWKCKFLDIPVVHKWAAMLEQLLLKHLPQLKFVHRRYNFVPTIDIDHAWCYLGRTLSRTMGGFGRSLAQGRFREIHGRFKTLTGLAPDPYDTYAYINSVQEPYGVLPLWFILFADYGTNDNNVTVTSRSFHRLLRELDRYGSVGIHPSLSSNKHFEKLEDEYDGLCDVLNRDVTISRQHFLKISWPKTYRNLIQFGITDDYSMGYASHIGFRAGIAIPFRFFDLARDEITNLMIHPVAVMDVTLKDYLRLNKVESLEKIESMINTIRSIGGEFVSLWHNESLSGTGHWRGWKEVYEKMVAMAST